MWPAGRRKLTRFAMEKFVNKIFIRAENFIPWCTEINCSFVQKLDLDFDQNIFFCLRVRQIPSYYSCEFINLFITSKLLLYHSYYLKFINMSFSISTCDLLQKISLLERIEIRSWFESTYYFYQLSYWKSISALQLP